MARVDKVEPVKGNCIIAEWLGFKIQAQFFTHPSDKEISGLITDLKYHSDWNHLMPVILLLEEKGVDVKIFYKNCHIEWSDEDCSYEVGSGIQGETKIDSVWTAIVYFLSWVKDSNVDLENPVWYE